MNYSDSIKFSELYDKFFQKSYLFVKSYVHNNQAAEDIASDSIIKLWETIEKEEIKNVNAFLLTTLKNHALDYLRKESVRNKVHDIVLHNQTRELNFRISTLEECDPSLLYSEEIQNIIDASLSTLSARTREVFEMSRYEHLSNKEIADKLKLSVKSIEYHITKVLTLLRNNLKDYLPATLILFYFI
ncbi:MAG: RNA polymerase sigma-70 factor [Dysgonamonadaceae bacterium]|jgi:RNA polymerase sigma-70 factor (ECF subfamily)|nr:RNA polymerase sigma-70 factor [Dysgonamonadaceae bacterium]MDD4606020.1 RNA polymerase sigma-70 factor [Dysgonamonadaceae bacterium]